MTNRRSNRSWLQPSDHSRGGTFGSLPNSDKWGRPRPSAVQALLKEQKKFLQEADKIMTDESVKASDAVKSDASATSTEPKTDSGADADTTISDAEKTVVDSQKAYEDAVAELDDVRREEQVPVPPAGETPPPVEEVSEVTVQELADGANQLRAAGMAKVAAVLDHKAEEIIETEKVN